jgi:hypothetical protein
VAGWLKIAARSFAMAAVAGAAQLGAAQALAVLVWSSVPSPEIWRRQLMWVLFIFAAAVLAGVAGGRRSVRSVRQAIMNRRADAAAAHHSGLVMHRGGVRAARQRAIARARYRTVDTARGFVAGASRVGATVFASLGAYAAFLLVWLPARNAYAGRDLRVLAVAALIGTGIGAVVSLLALLAAPIAANAAIWVAGVWIFGLASVGVAIGTGNHTITPRLAVLDAPNLIGPDEWWLGPYVMVLVAAVFAATVAATARWVGAHPLGIALSGLAGPAMVGAGYLLVGPGYGLRSGYVAALLSAAVGMATSTVTAVARRGKTAPLAAAAIASAAAGARSAAPAQRAITASPGAPYAAAPRAGQSTKRRKPATPSPAYAAAGVTSAPYPAPNPASQYPAAQYSANPYPTNQYPTWSQPARSTSTTPAGVYVAPPRGAPVTPPSPTTSGGTAAKPSSTKAPTTKAPTTKAPNTKAPTASAPPTPSPAIATAAAAAAAQTGQKPPPKSKRRGRADKSVRVPEAVQPEPVTASSSSEVNLPRTTRPAQVVAVKPSRPSPDAEPALPKGRRARRRAAKLAAERAEQEERIARQRERDAQSLGKREREHIAWLENLTSMPADPTLTTRKK